MVRGLLILSLFMFSCTHSVHLVHVSDFGSYQKQTSGKIIKASEEDHLVMGFTLSTNYVEKARKKLIAQCENGEIQGVTSRLSTSHGFFSWKNKILMQGLCIK